MGAEYKEYGALEIASDSHGTARAAICAGLALLSVNRVSLGTCEPLNSAD